MITDERTWVLLADGGNAKIAEYHSADGGLELVPDGKFEQPNLPSRELVTDGPGAGYAGNGYSGPRSAPEFSSDPHQYEELRFVGNVAKFLDEHVDDYDNLIVVAAPKALGNLRQKMSSNVQKKVYAQLNKDLVKLPLNEVRAHLQDVMPISSERH